MNRKEMLYLQDTCRFLIKFKKLQKHRNTYNAVTTLATATNLKRCYFKSQTYQYMYDFFSMNLDSWDEYKEILFEDIKYNDLDEVKEMLGKIDHHALLTFGDVLSISGIGNPMSKEELIKHISVTATQDRDIDYYEEFIYDTYLCEVEESLYEFLEQTDDQEIAVWNYEDDISSHLFFSKADVLEIYVSGDLATIRDTVFGYHDDYIFEGNIKDFSEETQLFLHLQ